MLWLIPAVIACLGGAFFLWNRGMQWPAGLFVAAGFGLVFMLGRSIERNRDAQWQEAAARLQGTFRSGPSCTGADQFGATAPWNEWSRDGELQCQRTIEGHVDGTPYALLQIRYSVR